MTVIRVGADFSRAERERVRDAAGRDRRLAVALGTAGYGLDPGRWYRTPPPGQMGEENHADAWAAFRDPAVVHGMCEDYRAGLRIDRAHEEADRAAGRKVTCPVLLLVSADDDIDIHGDPETIWRPWVAGELHSRLIPPGTTKPKKRQANSPWHCCSSSARSISARQPLAPRLASGCQVRANL